MTPQSTIAILILMGVLSGCQTTSQLRSISVEEAFSDIRLAENSHTPPVTNSDQAQSDRPTSYVQPVNKSVPCKIPATQDQLDRKNFRSYWDGDCKSGFAFGLGREISLSDNHHSEEITTYEDDGMPIGPGVIYDFVHKNVSYGSRNENSEVVIGLTERILDEIGNFRIEYMIRQKDKGGSDKAIQWSAFHPVTVFINANENVVYKFDIQSVATSLETPIHLIQTIKRPPDPKPIGYTIAKYANGHVRHLKASNGELVFLPDEYVLMLMAKFNEVSGTYQKGIRMREQAKVLEREYLHLACNGTYEVPGVEKGIANKICTWRDQFKEPFERAQKKYNDWLDKNLERLKAEARSQQEQQRLYQEQQRIRQQQEQQAWDAFNRGLDSFGESMDSIMRNTPRTTYTNCTNNYGNTVSCTSTSY